ncbi:MAG: peptidoglycan DD-metalloendopeptidase family protein [Acidimicrobiales bacterium]
MPLAVALAVALVLVTVPAVAVAQTTSTTSTTKPPGSSTSTTRPTTLTSTTSTVPAPEPEDDAPPEDPPDDEVLIAPSDAPQKSDVPPPVLQKTVARSIDHLNLLLQQSMTAAAASAANAVRLEAEIRLIGERLDSLATDKSTAIRDLVEVRSRMRDRAVAAYMGSPVSDLNTLVASRDPQEFVRRAAMVRSVASSDRQRREDLDEAKRLVTRQADRLVSLLAGKESAAAVARALADGYATGLALAEVSLVGTEVGGSILASGFVFPVAGPRTFSDTWGAPRMPGTVFEHKHQGTDIFAESGTTLVACERGVVVRIGSDVLGGTKLWLVGASGTRYYYAHLSGFVDGLFDGMAVEAGQVVGYVGNSGNARTTPPHLHFQVHPGGGAPINPYPMLRIVDDAVRDLTEPPGR